jgi:isopentenyl diphosphate isomerase/L-lactate dehydrogenase-like FMN-dependent dehydrogenase
MSEFETIQEIVAKANREMPQDLWEHVSGGAESETTLRRNRQALDRLALRPRVLRDVSHIDPSTQLLGRNLRIPVLLAPLGELHQIHPDGALPCLLAARGFRILSFLSSINLLTLETAAEMARESLVFQLYLQGDPAWLDKVLERVAEANCQALCLTVDTAYYSRRERDLINRYAPPGRREKPREGFEYQASMTWDLVDRIRRKIETPLILKGITTAEDARLAVEHGVQVIYVSNHGGRQLDHACGSMDVLPEVLNAVDGKAEVVVDGGFMRGTDILKAVAMGARAVGIGKLQAWALAAGGGAGLTRMLEILETEISMSMGLLGVTSLKQLNPSYLRADLPVQFPDEFSPFPIVERRRPRRRSRA